MSQDQIPAENPTNQTTRRSRRTVEPPKPSKEFHTEADHLTVEVVHAERVLREYFEKLGYEEWIYGCLCSRKLLEKVQQRIPNPSYPAPPATVTPYTEELRRQLETTPLQQWVVDPTPFRQVQEGPEPRPLIADPAIFADEPQPSPMTISEAENRRRAIEMERYAQMEQTIPAPLNAEEEQRVMEHLALRRATQAAQEANNGTRGIPTPANDPAHDTPF